MIKRRKPDPPVPPPATAPPAPPVPPPARPGPPAPPDPATHPTHRQHHSNQLEIGNGINGQGFSAPGANGGWLYGNGGDGAPAAAGSGNPGGAGGAAGLIGNGGRRRRRKSTTGAGGAGGNGGNGGTSSATAGTGGNGGTAVLAPPAGTPTFVGQAANGADGAYCGPTTVSPPIRRPRPEVAVGVPELRKRGNGGYGGGDAAVFVLQWRSKAEEGNAPLRRG